MSTIDKPVVCAGEEVGEALDALRKVLVVLKLTAYATDAMRVLNVLQQQADRCQTFDQAIKSVCVNWRTLAVWMIQLT